VVHNEIHAIDLAIIAAYLIAMVLIGRLVVKKVKSMDDYYLGGRSFGPLVLMATLCATIIGGSGLIKMPHGPVTQVEEPGPNARHKTYIKKEVPLRYGSVESNAVKNRLTSRPTAVPFNVDAWVVGHVL